MGQALYRKYRSKRLAEIIGQEHITKTLEQAISSGRISHAYLFTGPRGVGKTSIARILAHEVNELPYTNDSTHMDIIEIDAASNRRIDEIRELREKVHVAPTSARYKVYIIDEVHMLTREAFNALLKTLEEPPSHVIFILATTDAHKLPETIISRTQRYTFRPVAREKVIEHLAYIAKQEKITISEEALGLLAEHGEGSFRDSISLLDQASSRGEAIDLSDVQMMLGVPPLTAVVELLATVMQQLEPRVIAQQLAALQDQGFQATSIAKQLAVQLRSDIIAAKPNYDARQALSVLARLIEVPIAHDPERFLELSLLAVALDKRAPEPKQPTTAIPAAPVAMLVAKIATEPPIKAAAPARPVKPAKEPEPEPPKTGRGTISIEAVQPPEAVTGPPVQKVSDVELWPQLLNALKSKYNTLYGVVRMAHPSFIDEQTLQLAFSFAFHQKRINDAKNQKIITDVIEQLSGKKLHIVCILDKQLAHQPDATSTAVSPPKVRLNDAPPSAISTIFGGGEMVKP